ncbi:transcription antitermination factor NusB, partial [Paenibacillus elgii]
MSETNQPSSGRTKRAEAAGGRQAGSTASGGAKGSRQGNASRASKGPVQGSAREAALDVLVRIEQDRSYSNLLLNQTLQKYKLDKPDAGLATEIVYGTVQRLGTIDFFLERFVSKGLA